MSENNIKRSLLAETDFPSRVKDLSHVRNVTVASDEPVTDITVTAKPGETGAQSRAKAKMAAFIKAIKEDGLSPEDAAVKVGIDLGAVARISSQADMQRVVRDAIGNGHVRAELRKEMLRGILNTNIVEAHLSGDRKGVYDGYKLAAADPEIGLSGPSTVVNNTVNITDLMGMIGEFLPEEK